MVATRAHSVFEAIELALAGTDSMVQCPAHDDNNASLHVSPGTTQPVILHCHAGCTTEDILLEGRVDPQMLMKPRDPNDSTYVGDDNVWTPRGNASNIYTYVSAEGEELFQVLRIPEQGGKKTFLQRHRDEAARSGWAWNMNGVERVLYHLPEVLQAREDGRIIFLVEGEKDVETLRKAGEVATTMPMGAKKWDDSYTEALRGANVAIIADADNSGRAHARMVRGILMEAGCSVTMLEAMNGQKDVTDHYNAGGTVRNLIETHPEQEDTKESFGVDLLDIIKRVVSQKSFVIPGVLARGDRLLITGFEGHGKSTLLRQMAVMLAAGIHPWTGLEIPPQRVIVIDSENHPDQTVESFQRLAELAALHGRPVQPGMLTVLEEWDTELDLTSEEGHAWLQERVHAYQPDAVFMGPLYNLSSRDLKDDESARRIKRAVNDARAICGSAFIMEHHAPHKGPMESKRSIRPYGSSTFLKWPDFGYGLLPTETEGVYEWQKTRFPRVRTRQYPAFLRWGKPDTLEWPWMTGTEDDLNPTT